MVGHTVLLLWMYGWSSKIGREVERSTIVLVECWSWIVGCVLVGLLLVVTYDHNPGFDYHAVDCRGRCGEDRLVIWLVSFTLAFSG